MFASKKFRDVFSEMNTGFPPNLYTSTTASGSPLLMGGSTGRRKMVFHLHVGSGAAVGQAQLLLYAASVSTGTGATLLGAQSAYPTILASVATATAQVAVVEVRGEYLATTSVGPWIIPLFSGSGASSYYMSILGHGFLHAAQPALNYDSSSYVTGEYLIF